MNTAETDSTLMTLAEAAAYLHLQISTLRAWRLNRRHLPFVQLGRKVFVRRADAEAFIASNLHAPTAPAHSTHRTLQSAVNVPQDSRIPNEPSQRKNAGNQ